MSVRYLADYIVASDRVRRRLIRECKYRAIARILQHDEARAAVASHLLNGSGDPGLLEAKAEFIRNKLATDDFEASLNEHNADYVDRFAEVLAAVALPKKAVLAAGIPFPDLNISGLAVALRPDLFLSRLSAKNEPKRGLLSFRYKKNTPLPKATGEVQSALSGGLMRLHAESEAEYVDRTLCITLCAHSGTAHAGPSNSISIFNDARAACATIADQWEKITPPPGAILA